jgi:hypothetical protein
LALWAHRPIGEYAAAAETCPYEVAIDFGADQVRRRRHLGAGLLAGEIAARIRRCAVELQERKREFGVVEM